MKLILSILIYTFLSISARAIHPTHMSVVNIEIDSELNELSYTIRIFQDDFNYLITSLYHEELFHSSDPFDLSLHTERIDNYFLKNFKLTTDSIDQQPVLIKKVSQQTDYSLYYLVKLQEIPKSLLIKNSLFLDLFSNQTNLVIFSYKNKEKGLTFDFNTQSQHIYLDSN